MIGASRPWMDLSRRTTGHGGGAVLIQNEHELEVTRQRSKAFQDALMALRHHQSPRNYTHIAQNFLYEINKVEAEVPEYLQRFPTPEPPAVHIPV
jgi:hypothetical protein